MDDLTSASEESLWWMRGGSYEGLYRIVSDYCRNFELFVELGSFVDM